MKKNYKIFKLDNDSFEYMVLRLFAHDAKKQWANIEEELIEMKVNGWILLDNLFRGGNISTRFTKVYFDRGFSEDIFFCDLIDDTIYRQLSATYIKENKLAKGSILTEEEIALIEAGQTI